MSFLLNPSRFAVVGGAPIVIEDFAYTQHLQADPTTANYNLPSTSSGDLLMGFISNDGGTGDIPSTPAGWTAIISAGVAGTIKVVTRTADGTEGSTVSMTVASAEAVSSIFIRISGATGLVEAAGGYTAGATATPQPPDLSKSFGGEAMYIFILATDDPQFTTGWPAGTDNQLTTRVSTYSNGNDSGIALCSFNSTGNISGFANWTLPASLAYNAYTLAIEAA